MERRTSGEPFDEAAFAAWLGGDGHRKAVFEAMWGRVMGPELDIAVRAFDRRRSATRAVLASGVSMLLAGGLLYQAVPMLEMGLATPQLYAAQKGGVRDVRLPDGTRLTLAGGARIEVRYTRHDRRVELLHGAIYADVIHDERRPFRIETPNAAVVDIGTSFEVVSKTGETRVTVTSGTVDFGHGGWFDRPIRLRAKQAAIVGGASMRRLADMHPTDVARWRNEWTEYRGVPLRQVVADLDSLSAQRIEIDDDVLARKPVSGRVRLVDPMGQLQNLAITHDFQIRHAKGVVIVTAK